MASPLGPNRKHPCPRTRWPAYQLQPVSSTMASLYGVCWKEVDNLLNRTLLAVETSGSMKQVWGLLEQDSIYGRLGRFKNSLHDMYNKYISTNEITTHYTLLYHTRHNRPDGDRRQTHAYPRPRFSRVPAGMHARHMRVIIITSVSISNSMEINNMHPCI